MLCNQAQRVPDLIRWDSHPWSWPVLLVFLYCK